LVEAGRARVHAFLADRRGAWGPRIAIATMAAVLCLAVGAAGAQRSTYAAQLMVVVVAGSLLVAGAGVLALRAAVGTGIGIVAAMYCVAQWGKPPVFFATALAATGLVVTFELGCWAVDLATPTVWEGVGRRSRFGSLAMAGGAGLLSATVIAGVGLAGQGKGTWTLLVAALCGLGLLALFTRATR
jgi:hypothetical protein